MSFKLETSIFFFILDCHLMYYNLKIHLSHSAMFYIFFVL